MFISKISQSGYTKNYYWPSFNKGVTDFLNLTSLEVDITLSFADAPEVYSDT